MKKSITLLLILTLIMLSLSGCYDANSVEKFYYIIALGLDKGTNSKLNLNIQIAIPDSGSDSSSQSTTQKIYSVECDTINSGINILNNYLSKKLNSSHCSVIIFSEELAKTGISTEINTLTNNNSIRPNSNILISNTTAKELMEKASNSGENFSARFYEFIINSTEYTGFSSISRFGNIFYDFNNNYTEGIANYIKITDNFIQNDGIAVFKNDKMVGTLNPEESIAHSIVINEVETAIISIENPFKPNSLLDISITLDKLYSNVYIVNNTPYIKIEPKIVAKIKNSTEDIDYSAIKNINIIEEKLNSYLNNLISNYLYKISREFNSDIAYLGEIYSTKCLTDKQFNLIHWNEIFKDSIFDVSVTSTINASYLFNEQ